MGTDKWGAYFNFTGHEGIGCFWCGSDLSKAGYGRYRYCCPEHRQLYHKHFSWAEARDWAIERASIIDRYGFKLVVCQDCSCQLASGRDYAVHHIVPLEGEYRAMNWLNRPENLAVLCHTCHSTRHRELNYLLKKSESIDKQMKFNFGGIK